DGRADEDLLQRARLRVGAVEDRHLGVRHPGATQRLGLVCDELGLIVLRIAGEPDDLLAVAAVRPELLVFAIEVVADHGIGGREDVLGGAVVLLEQHDLRARVVLLELTDVADVRAAEGVDRLIRIAHDSQRRRRKLRCLGRRRRLEDHHPAVTVRLPGAPVPESGRVSSWMSAYWAWLVSWYSST